jgi:hypothetical protein
MYQNVVITDEVMVTDERGMVEIDFNLDQDALLETLSKLSGNVAKNAKQQNSIDESLKSLKTFVDVNVSKLIRGSVTTDEVMKRQSETIGKIQAEVKMLGTTAVRKDDFDKFEKSSSTKLKKCELFVDEVASGSNAALTNTMKHFLESFLPKWFEPQSVKMNKRIADELEAKSDQIRATTFLQMQQMSEKMLEQKHEIGQLKASLELMAAMLESQKDGGGALGGSAPTKGHPTAAEKRDEASIAASATVNHIQAKLSAVEGLVRDVKVRTERLSAAQDSMATAIGMKPKRIAPSTAGSPSAGPLPSFADSRHRPSVPSSEASPTVPAIRQAPVAEKAKPLPLLAVSGDDDELREPGDSDNQRGDSFTRQPAINPTDFNPGEELHDRNVRSVSPSKWGVVRQAVTPQPADTVADSEQPLFVTRLKEELLRSNVEALQAKQKEMQDEMMKFKAALDLRVKEQLAEKVGLATLKDHLSRNRDQSLYANVSKCLSSIEELRKSKLDNQDITKLLQSKAEKTALDLKVDVNFFRTTIEQTDFRIGEIAAEVKAMKVATSAAERNTNAAIKEMRASMGLGMPGSGGLPPGLGGLGQMPAMGHVSAVGQLLPMGQMSGLSPVDAALYPPRPPGMGVTFPNPGGLDGHPPMRRDQSERTLSPPKRSVSKRGSTAEGMKKKLPEVPATVEVPTGAPAAPTSLPSLSHLLFKVEPEQYKALRAESEKEGKPLVTPRPPPDEK